MAVLLDCLVSVVGDGSRCDSLLVMEILRGAEALWDVDNLSSFIEEAHGANPCRLSKENNTQRKKKRMKNQ